MGRIYMQASRVVAWLGVRHTTDTGRPDNDEIAIHFLQELVDRKILKELRSLITLGESSAPPLSKLESLSVLCSKSYWERLWVIQELVLAKTVLVQCGFLIFDLNHFSFIDRLLLRDMDYNARMTIMRSLPVKIVKLRKERRQREEEQELRAQSARGKPEEKSSSAAIYLWTPGQPYDSPSGEGCSSLVEIMQETSVAKCADRRDKVFGLLNLCFRCCRDAIRPDYSKSLAHICESILEHHITWHSNQRPDHKSPVHITRILLEGLGLRMTKIVGEPSSKRPEDTICLTEATNLKLHNVNGTFQQVMWVYHPLDTQPYASNMPFIPERLHSRLGTVLDAAKNGSLKPRFVFGEPLEGEEIYFKPNSEFQVVFRRSNAHAILDNGGTMVTKLSVGSSKGTSLISTASSRPIDGSSTSRYQGTYSGASYRESRKGFKFPIHSTFMSRGFEQREWEEFVTSRARSLAAQRLCVFITDEGKVGYATSKCKVGDLVCQMQNGADKVAIVETSHFSNTFVGKGVLLHHSVELGRRYKIELLMKSTTQSMDRFDEIGKRTLQMRLDLAHLLYLSGYF
ncbi:hypothetical protein EG329_005673 [Mollisiaceae sp. DMI_Dod_QoI]|nr:hypothetical protein EG329_005673 [Helotiales sp. DMI_Dod_QoI]